MVLNDAQAGLLRAFENLFNELPKTKNKNIKRALMFRINFTRTILSTLIGLTCLNTYAEDEQSEDEADKKTEVIAVTGIRESYLNAINTKRNSANIVDAISLKDIGALPDNSVAETLERITGVSADRFKGSASEISIRGLGPFLGMSTLNGRAISSGSGNRSVAFSQFPSELVNGVTVYKSQSANILEGGVSGTIDLGTIRPVDYGKQRFQSEFKGIYNEYQAKKNDDKGLGHRASISYVNSYDLGEGKIGFALGYAGGKTPRPEDTYLTSSLYRPCNSDASRSEETQTNCTFSDTNAAAGGGRAVDGDYYFAPNGQLFRQINSIDESNAMIAAVQWKPSSSLDINLDSQWSERYFFEDRHDLFFHEGRRGISNWVTNEEHILQSYTGESFIGTSGDYRDRNEEYKGLGINVKWQINEDFAITADAAYSGTERWQNSTRARFRSQRHFFDWEQRGDEQFPNISNVYTDRDDPVGSSIDWTESVKDFTFFNNDSQARKERFDISDRIRSFKLDAEYYLEHNIFTSILTGFAFSSRAHVNLQNDSISFNTGVAELVAAREAGLSNREGRAARALARANVLSSAAENCLTPWPQKDFGDDANSPVSEWAIADNFCAFDVITGGETLEPSLLPPSEGDIDLIEKITSVFAMSNFETDLAGMFLSGNVGVRYVQTEINSAGISQAYETITDDEGFITLIEQEGILETQAFDNKFSNLLPSINMTLELAEEVELRFAAYKAVSRPDMWFYGAGRRVSIGNDEDNRTVEDALQSVSARGNPELELLESDNYEFGVNWFFAAESILSVALYNKAFSARIGAQSKEESIIVDGVPFLTTVFGSPTIFEDESTINGVEITLNHQFSTLPAPYDGLGFAGSYNYSDSDYETPEAGAFIVPAEGVIETIEPANLPGLSNHVGNIQMYWEGSGVSARISYKFRSDYIKPFGNDLSQTNRFVEPQRSFDLSLGYKISKNFSVKAQMLNLTNEPAIQSRVIPGAYSLIEHSGRKLFLGVKYRK